MKVATGRCEKLMLDISPGTVDLIVTSPPFGTLRRYKGFELSLPDVVSGIKHCLHPKGVVCWSVQDQIINGKPMLIPERHKLMFAEHGFYCWDVIYWKKAGVPAPTQSRYYNVIETVFVLSRGRPKTLNLICDRVNLSAGKKEKRRLLNDAERSRGRNGAVYFTKDIGRRTNVWEYTNQRKDVRGHPAAMNISLAKDLVRSYSNEGDMVLDPMCGSGTTLIAAEELGRRWHGIDIAKEYTDMSQRRIAVVRSKLF